MDKVSVSITIKYAALIIGMGITILAVIAYAGYKDWTPLLDSVLKIFGLGVAATTAIYAAMNLRCIVDSHRENIIIHEQGVIQKRKEYSASQIEKWVTPEVASLASMSHQAKQAVIELDNEATTKWLIENKEHGVAIVFMFNFFENMSISIDHGLADEEMLKAFFDSIVCNNYTTLRSVIDSLRKKNNNPKIFSGFEQLAERWA